ncbi:primosomal protein N' [Wenzhouxiangella sp. AB-CW3]|uniref:primosomal protein N' n=1 Tax=Wenzhouxiangella sp. AB-CW3 TaxID=2771012 RepID=UPI00168A952B|nr:primosomal protein N' [Wenzhouxiangella sp. AB-CW3]QOC22800.1 primosomal protein N' [Wenzhouxiangella sp. AB-CW3]
MGSAPLAARVVVPVPLPRPFDYLPPSGQTLPPVGSRVLVPFGKRECVGLVVDHQAPTHASDRLKPISQVLDPALVSPQLLELALWCCRYYGAAPGEAVNLLLPGALRRIRGFRPPPLPFLALTEAGRSAGLERAPRQAEVRESLIDGARPRQELIEQGIGSEVLRRMHQAGLLQEMDRAELPAPEPGPTLNAQQRHAVAAVLAARHRFECLLLAGITGSGKTEVYLRAARRMLARDRQVLILIPEIGLTAQLVRRIESRLGAPARVYHSGLSEGERLACWRAAHDGSARVIVGTRSAVFLPLVRPGLIVVDEEHDGSYKQAEGARYHGRDVAVMRARRLGIPIVLGSATPSLESLHNEYQGRYRLLELSERAGTARLPRWRVTDARGRGGGLDPELVTAIRRHLDTGGQVLVYRNRRGYAPVLMCAECGWSADCHRCDAHMTWHQSAASLQCHHCGHYQRTPPRCPECGSPELLALGAGTERLEDQFRQAFSDVPVHRVDRDSMSGRHDFDELLASVREGQPCILVGTQMLAKGHHLPGVTLAAVLDVDQALFSADFRAPERLGQVVCQVAGRAGRGEREGEFLLLTRHPEHPLVTDLARGHYLGFARRLLDERCAAQLPPATALALLRAEAHQVDAPRAFLKQAAGLLRSAHIEIIGPLPAIMTRRGGYWRFQLWLQADDRARLSAHLGRHYEGLHELPASRQVRWHLDMDALEL